MKKSCELCNREAKMYCDSDQANLCWDCDERVHSANFIVAKHSRNLLCHVCKSITQWKASGSKFGPTFSVCNSCFSSNNNNQEGWSRSRTENQETEIDGDFDEDYSDSDSEEDEDDEEENDDEEEEEEEEEDGDNQVVPWSIPTAVAHPPPPVATTSSSSEIGSLSFSIRGDKDVSSTVKRFRNQPFPDSEDEEDGCYCYSQLKIRAGVAVEDKASTGMPTTRRIGRLEGLSPQCQRSPERRDTEWQSTRIMDVGSSMLPRDRRRGI